MDRARVVGGVSVNILGSWKLHSSDESDFVYWWYSETHWRTKRYCLSLTNYIVQWESPWQWVLIVPCYLNRQIREITILQWKFNKFFKILEDERTKYLYVYAFVNWCPLSPYLRTISISTLRFFFLDKRPAHSPDPNTLTLPSGVISRLIFFEFSTRNVTRDKYWHNKPNKRTIHLFISIWLSSSRLEEQNGYYICSTRT